eukprot:6229085-Amphidinium_carterae.2
MIACATTAVVSPQGCAPSRLSSRRASRGCASYGGSEEQPEAGRHKSACVPQMGSVHLLHRLSSCVGMRASH